MITISTVVQAAVGVVGAGIGLLMLAHEVKWFPFNDKPAPQLSASVSAAPEPAPGPTGPGVQLLIDNRVTSGNSMREDSPAYLSTRTVSFCKDNGCALPDTDLRSGDYVTAVCWQIGDEVTNGNRESAVDDANPDLSSSRLWYKIVWRDGRSGFLSEVWVNASSRGERNLPAC
ncbi:hypothetical protein [Micromonospora sp. NBC_01796]|uniref:hypothetical protein n=1 Tax=Micromonospora sp. NBC_01796 TaxID=2975987 RepID=UPI002DDC589E|nr:hypothetical protein [Micromonospora sp. NBC_01796]WSA86698.1 hypothetical protein OIE47_03470 [Micromonospora sp. NBC_01796]